MNNDPYLDALILQFFEREGVRDFELEDGIDHDTLVSPRAFERQVMACAKSIGKGLIDVDADDEQAVENIIHEYTTNANLYYAQYAVAVLVQRGEVIPMYYDGERTFISTRRAEEIYAE